MPIICPTITAYDPHEYNAQIEQIESFAERIHIDLMDGEMTPKASPELDHIWWPEKFVADIHLMYRHPAEALGKLIDLKPHLIVVHFEADVNHDEIIELLHENNVKAGLSIIQSVTVDEASRLIEKYDHALVFSGNLGFHGGEADLSLLDKVREIKERFPDKEIGWDGGINDQNAKQLAEAGVDVLNTGGFIQKSENPADRYKLLDQIVA
jgi:ribulose-phosphate 3-epimerase